SCRAPCPSSFPTRRSSDLFLGVALATGGRPTLGVFMPTLGAMLSCHALLIPNFNTIAMEPMRPIAGTASAVIGTVSTAGGALIGAVLDQSFNGTILPMAGGFAILGFVAFVLVLWAERGRLFDRRRPT